MTFMNPGAHVVQSHLAAKNYLEGILFVQETLK